MVAHGATPRAEPTSRITFPSGLLEGLLKGTAHLITALVEEAVSVGKLVRILQFEGGNVRLVEVTLAPDAPVVDKAIKDLEFPRDATIVAVLRGEHVVMPRGDTVFEPGDEVLAMVTADAEDDVRRILAGD